MIKIDGSHGEGGGQILRTALALSCITGKSFEMYDIRMGREKPGLQPQHLTCVRAAQAISNADVDEAKLGSRRLCFSPVVVTGSKYLFDVSEIKGSAGSATLVLQAILPPLALSKTGSRVTVKGGTHVEWSPAFHYMRDVLLPLLAKIGIQSTLDIEKWGWYPIGGGKLSLSVEPVKKLSPISIRQRGRLKNISGISAASNLPISLAERQRDHGNWLLKGAGLSANMEIVAAPSNGKGTFFFILAEFENIKAGFSALGARGKRAEAVAEEAVRQFLEFSNSEGALDPHLADQIIPYLSICDAPSTFTTSRVTRHLLTNAWVTEKFLPVEININGREGQFGEVIIKRAGNRLLPAQC
jgi:RNA 3'-terminal phosphate cyclase (ATP)